ncbi:hypothetical protein HPB50_021595 [Hyalomma asiaticum]|uniref:Uncharacterized protein n=1 Tax=Hyalomma asiaticum TaxID=266040 RepID=A0ACB7TP75_HYAAI|nr:hypothetical protein HPB50_021595 [Hyalomma asiaticum]
MVNAAPWSKCQRGCRTARHALARSATVSIHLWRQRRSRAPWGSATPNTSEKRASAHGNSRVCFLSYVILGESLGFVQPIDIGQIYAVQQDSSRRDLDAVSALNSSDTPPVDLFDSSIANGLSPFERSQLLHLPYHFHDSVDVAQPVHLLPTFGKSTHHPELPTYHHHSH